mgnify:CR=1 FL=1
MEIYSFTGKSGTGKSYSAARICREKHIDAIIDDGLLIYRGLCRRHEKKQGGET